MAKKAVAKTWFCLLIGLLFLPYPAQAAEQDFLVTKIKITGNSVLSAKEITSVLDKYEGKRVTFAQLQEAAGMITKKYHDRGYILAKVYIPEQNITGGGVELAALEGKINDIKIEGEHKYYSDEFIKKHFNPVLKEGALNQETLERALLVLNDYPKLKVTANLQAGKEPGTTDILVKAENSMPVQLTLDYNNFGTKYVSKNRFGAMLDIGNVIKEGAIFSFRGTVGEKPEEMAYGRASYTIPVNVRGTKLGAYYAKGNFDVGREFAVLKIKGNSESYGFFLSHPIIKKRQHKLDIEFGFDSKNAEQKILDETTSYDKIRSVRGGLSYESTDATGRSFISFFLTQGLGENMGAMDNNYFYSSRKHADNRFTKYNLELMRLQRIFSSVFLILKGAGQLASDSLVSVEQFSIGGPDSVRGYSLSEYNGDDGFAISAELRVAPLKDKENFQIAFFVDTGGVSVKHPITGQTKGANITGGGGGLRIKMPYDIDVRADVGFPIDPNKSSEGSGPVYYFQVAKRF